MDQDFVDKRFSPNSTGEMQLIACPLNAVAEHQLGRRSLQERVANICGSLELQCGEPEGVGTVDRAACGRKCCEPAAHRFVHKS